MSVFHFCNRHISFLCLRHIIAESPANVNVTFAVKAEKVILSSDPRMQISDIRCARRHLELDMQVPSKHKTFV